MSELPGEQLLVPWDSPEPGDDRPRISVAVPTLNGGARLLDLLSAVYDQDLSDGELEVLVADSESDDGSISEVLERFPRTRLFTVERSRFNHGLVRTALVEAARAPLVAFFTQDAVPLRRDYLANMSASLEGTRVAGVYARQVPRAGADPLVREMLDCWTPPAAEGVDRGLQVQALPEGASLDSFPPTQRMKLARFDNVGSMVRAEVVRQIPFPVREFGEDISWGASVLAAGFCLAYLPTACVEHHHDPLIGRTFRRNRLAHRQAREEFGLHSVPDLRHLALALVAGMPQDFRQGPLWALRGLPRRGAALLGQWAGARDALREQCAGSPAGTASAGSR
jgi:GT2 family glycosyltransferase